MDNPKIENKATEILKDYWGYDTFRSSQLDIISSILNQKDTLALLPTGGGKSICFQVPAMMTPGICIVVTPLIALMEDQVYNLKKRGIKAIAIHGSMSKKQIDIALDNCIYGNYKFLYLSPERLRQDLFKVRFAKMKVSFVAIDEAHCISQWGYDFRPSYLHISELRKIHPEIKFLALTATATQRVVDDIQEKLKFDRKHVVRKSFFRENLRYFVDLTEDKFGKMMSIITKQKGSGIVYVRSRKATIEIASYLQKRGVSAAAYHGGMEHEERSAKQLNWQNNQVRVMVATNAFGMGVDKPDVRFVINLELPENIESYFQEAGRGGRDGNRAFGVLLVNESDRFQLEKRVQNKYPEIADVKTVYTALYNSLLLALGSGMDETYPISINKLVDKTKLRKGTVNQSLELLERAGYLVRSKGLVKRSKLQVLMHQKDLYNFQLRNPNYDSLIKLLLRSYSSLFEIEREIDEKLIAKRLGKNLDEISKSLHQLNKLEVVKYAPFNGDESITFLQPRIDVKNLRIEKEIYENIRNIDLSNMEAMISYAYSNKVCRSVQLLKYFGEDSESCGVCDVCLSNKKASSNQVELDLLELFKKTREKEGSFSLEQALQLKWKHENQLDISTGIRWLIDNNFIEISNENEIQFVS